jgi:uncharacterized protein YjbI with pentapeptide repeats
MTDAVGAIAGLLTALVAVASVVFAGYKYVSNRERLAAIRSAFREAVDALGAADPLQRRAGAIMLRRFFDDRTEQGARGTPYAGEALAVIAATLRGVDTDPFQKLLADGLAYAPSLKHADLQKTNLQGAYLVARTSSPVNLTDADFFRADLSGASLKGANAQGAVFYQARLLNTVLRDADLRGANFAEADLRGAEFEGAKLEGATFTDARNVPNEIARHLNENGSYSEERTTSAPVRVRQPVVFLSKPGAANVEVRQLISALVERIREEGLEVVKLDPASYASTGAVAEVRRIMGKHHGAVVIAVPDLVVREGQWRVATPQARQMAGEAWTTPWISLELGVAIGLGLPVLLAMSDEISPSVFDYGAQEPYVHRVRLKDDHGSRPFRDAFDDWCGAVRENADRAAQA